MTFEVKLDIMKNLCLYHVGTHIKEGNSFPKFNVGGGRAYLEPWGVRALSIIDYWSRGPRATYVFCPSPSPFCAFQRDTLSFSLKMNKKGEEANKIKYA